MKSKLYTPEMLQFMKDNIEGRYISELAELLNCHFGTNYSREQIKAASRNLGIKSSRKWRPEVIQFLRNNANGLTPYAIAGLLEKRFKRNYTESNVLATMRANHISPTRRRYTPSQILFLRKNARGNTYIQLTKLFNDRFNAKRTVKQIRKVSQQCGINTLVNKIKGGCPERSIGDEIYDGKKVLIKAENGQWQLKHRWVWEKAHGPIPSDHLIIFVDGNRYNFELENLFLIPRVVWLTMRSNGLIFNDKEMIKTSAVIAKHRLSILERITHGMLPQERRKALCKMSQKKFEAKQRGNVYVQRHHCKNA